MDKAKFTKRLFDTNKQLLDLTEKACSNNISKDCLFIATKIENSNKTDLLIQQRTEWIYNSKKTPKSFDKIAEDLYEIYEDLYDINFQVFKSTKNKTIVIIRYFLKSSLDKDFFIKIRDNEPMLHCKIPTPPYSTDLSLKFDINWQSGGLIYNWKMFWWKIRR